MKTKQALGVWALAALTFFGVSGGPYGSEELVSSGGPLNAIVIVCVVPWIWGLPMALMTAEMATMMPEMGGYIIWVQRAFGPFWAFQNGIWKIACNIIDNALYPNLFLYYVMDLTGPLTYESRLLISYALVVFVCICNVVGVDVVSDAATVFVLMTLLPFVVLVIAGLANGRVDPADWSRGREDGKPVSWGTFVTIALWKTSGYDNAGSVASEVKNPSKAFPKAMTISVILVTMCYLFPILVGVSYASDYHLWADGYFVQVAKLTAGDWLGVWVTVTGAVTALGMLNTTICTSSRAIQSMAHLGFFPKVLARINPKFLTPDVAVIVNCFVLMLILIPDMDFAEIANTSMWFYALTIFILFAAYLRLRVVAPYLPRPYKIPLGLKALTVFVALPPCVCCAFLLAFSSQATWLVGLTVCAMTFVLWFPFRWYVGKNIYTSRVMAEAHSDSLAFSSSSATSAVSPGATPLPSSRPVPPSSDDDDAASVTSTTNLKEFQDDLAALERTMREEPEEGYDGGDREEITTTTTTTTKKNKMTKMKKPTTATIALI